MAYTDTQKTETVVTTFDLGVIRIDGDELYADSFKITRKRKLERVTATNSMTGIAWKVSGEEYSWEASDVTDPDKKLEALWIKDGQNPNGFQVDTYDFQPGGDLVPKDTLLHCKLSEYDGEKNNGDKTSAKGEALDMLKE